MKKIIKIIPLILSFSLILGLTSCVNAAAGSGSSSDKTVIFCGSFSIDESYITQDSNSVMASRSAQPTIPAEANLTYYAKATNGSETLTSQDIDTGTGTFSIPLQKGSSWTIEVGATGTSAVNTSVTDVILIKDSVVFNPNAPANDEPGKEYSFYLKPYVSDSGSGKLNLRVKIQDPSGNKITKVEIVPKKCLSKPNDTSAVTAGWNELSSWNTSKSAAIYTSSLSDFYISKNGFKSGIWEVAVNFRDNEDQLLYSSIQIICVYDNLETKTWESSKTVADSNELIPSTGENAGVLYLTTLLVDSYGLTDFYVDKTRGDDETGNGSPMKPFKTITKAIAVVNGLNRRDKTYTIHIKDGSGQTVNTPIVVTSNLSIECYKDSYGDRNGSATITSTCADGPILQVGDDALVSTLTIDGIRKTNNTPDDPSDDTWTGLQLVSNSSRFGTQTRGVEIKSNGSFFMNGGSITGNRCNNTGAGVNIHSGGYFILTAGRISANISSTGLGGGIYVSNGGDLLIKGGIITANTASAGAGIYVAGNISINGACYISGNSNGSVLTNIYLPDDKLITINGNIDGATIGVTTQTAPTIGNNIRFTEGYAYGKQWTQNKNDDGTYNHPFKYFHSDVSGYSILTDPTPDDPATEDVDENNGDAYLGISGGTITQKTIPEITLGIARESANDDDDKICYQLSWSHDRPLDTGYSITIGVKLTYNGVAVPSDFWFLTSTNKLYLYKTLPAGKYNVEAELIYRDPTYFPAPGLIYAASLEITKTN